MDFKNKNTITIDSETEGLNLLTHRPWQIAWNKMVKGHIVDEQERFIWWPDLQMTQGAAIVTGFDYDFYKANALPAEEVWAEFSEILYDESNILGGHNIIGYDLGIIMNWAKRVGGWRGWKTIPQRCIDSLLIGRKWNREEGVDKDNFLGDQLKEIGKPPRGSKKCKLSDLADYLNIPYDKTKLHNAKYDIWLNAQVIKQLIYKMEL